METPSPIAECASYLDHRLTALELTDPEIGQAWETVKKHIEKLEDEVRDLTHTIDSIKSLHHDAHAARSSFLAQMSHDLRTPLNAVIGFSQVLRKQYFGALNEKQSEYVNDILESGTHLLSLIDDLLDPSRVEAGKPEH